MDYAGQPIDPYQQMLNQQIAQYYPYPQAGGMLAPGMVPNPAGANASVMNPNVSAVQQQNNATAAPFMNQAQNFQQQGQPGQQPQGAQQQTANTSPLFSSPTNAAQAIANGLRDPNVQKNLKNFGYGIGDAAGSLYDKIAGAFGE